MKELRSIYKNILLLCKNLSYHKYPLFRPVTDDIDTVGEVLLCDAGFKQKERFGVVQYTKYPLLYRVSDGALALAINYTDADRNPYIEGVSGSVATGGAIISYAFSAIYDETEDKLTSMQMYSSTGAARKVTAIYGVA